MIQLPPLSREKVRSIDAAAINNYGLLGICLMENAGRGAAEIIDKLANPGVATILCGSGNNGGDGFVIARHLQLLGWDVRILLLADGDSLQGDAKTNWQVAIASKIEILPSIDLGESEIAQALEGTSAIVDAMLGTGASGNPRNAIARAVRAANSCDAIRFAIDLPSGLDCDTGQPGEPCFRADHTCTFVAPKQGFSATHASDFLGQVHVVSIGAPLDLLSQYAS